VANSAALIEPDGPMTVYRKAHLWDREKLISPRRCTAAGGGNRRRTHRGDDLLRPGVTRWVRRPALAGGRPALRASQLAGWPAPGRRTAGEIVRVQANAAVNRLFIAACDRHGQERGVDWVGGSVIVDADGYPQAGAVAHPAEQRLVADLPLAQSRDKCISAHNHVHQDRRRRSTVECQKSMRTSPFGTLQHDRM
jgi:predicted amidohydrolase